MICFIVGLLIIVFMGLLIMLMRKSGENSLCGGFEKKFASAVDIFGIEVILVLARMGN